MTKKKICKECNFHGLPDEHQIAYCSMVGGHTYLGSLACPKFDDTVCF